MGTLSDYKTDSDVINCTNVFDCLNKVSWDLGHHRLLNIILYNHWWKFGFIFDKESPRNSFSKSKNRSKFLNFKQEYVIVQSF